MVYMFNELSLTKVNSIQDVRNVLEVFIKSTIRAKELGFTELRLYECTLPTLYQISLSENYNIYDWLKDSHVDNNLQDRFRDIITSFPLIKESEMEEKETYEWSIFSTIDNQRSFGLGAAYIFGTLCSSLLTKEIWNSAEIILSHNVLDRQGNEHTTGINVRHFSSEENIELHKQWIENEQKESLEKSADLWNNRTQYFPNILFGKDLEAQLQTIGLTKKFFRVFDCLKKLDAFAKSWLEGGFNLNDLRIHYLLDVSGESDSTMQKYSVERKFRLENGTKAQFEFHIKIPDLRIYFLPNETNLTITIGYIGKHLRTCLYD